MRWVWVQLAAGKGERFAGHLPKQFLRLGGKPVLAYSIEVFLSVSPHSCVVVVLPLTHFQRGRRVLTRLFSNVPLYFTVGGETRSASTEAALSLLESLGYLQSDYLIAFHDAVRPFVSASLIERVFEAAATHGAAVCGLPVPFSVRRITATGSEAIPRNSLWEVQTPQVFRGDILRIALQKLPPTSEGHFTDEGSWIETAGFPVTLVAGEPTNLKITYPIDWEVAKAWLKRRNKSGEAKSSIFA
ncbi:MAG: IspD/TarI family cytidylyltransferase [Bacteroidia bacterium]|nr:2-C-methyl-D-erythritol 4-phosphate cytidylyltransferase [Bacteroidia bacterium]MDW8134935.1 IspD/TarI family cytidylyltransferase [Bacteroidia bacterium]